MKALIVYFSRTGRTEKAANAIKSSLEGRDADIDFEKIVPLKDEPFIKSAFGSLLRLESPILNTSFDVSQYDLIIIGCPVYSLSTPMPVNSYIQDVQGLRGKCASAFVTEGMGGGSLVLNQISRNITKRGARYREGIVLSGNELLDSGTLKKTSDDFVQRLLGR